jgi:hypothetical protein
MTKRQKEAEHKSYGSCSAGSGLLRAMLNSVIIHISSIERRLLLFEVTLAYAAAKASLTTYNMN